MRVVDSKQAGTREVYSKHPYGYQTEDTPCCIGVLDSEMPYIRRRAFNQKWQAMIYNMNESHSEKG